MELPFVNCFNLHVFLSLFLIQIIMMQQTMNYFLTYYTLGLDHLYIEKYAD